MKRIIVCCDGTWNADDLQTNDTNVAVLARAIHGSQQTGGALQIVLYVRGVGTTGLKLETLIEGATGSVWMTTSARLTNSLLKTIFPAMRYICSGFPEARLL